MNTSDFRYELPEAAIAQEPIEPRDAARLLVAGSLVDWRFSDLPSLLDPDDLLVVNRTRVRRARLVGRKETGGRAELLLLGRQGGEWTALVRPARRLRRGSRIVIGPLAAVLSSDPVGGVAAVRFEADEDVEELIEQLGEVPLPPYFTGSLADPDRYQTMFAKTLGSAAAPTAGLHFTPAVAAGLAARGIAIAEVDLEVGVDTFRPIAAERIEDHVMHRERFTVPEATAEAVADAKRRGGKVVAVGTTVVRALESCAAGGEPLPVEGETDLFIFPGYRFRVVDRLVTNFHVPGSTLIVLVAAFMGERWREAYRHALDRGYRFLSFGDAMLADRS